MKIRLKPSTFLTDFRSPEAHPSLNEGNILFVNHAKYLGVIFDMRITWRLHIEIIEYLRTFIRIYSLLKSEYLSASIKPTLDKVLTSSVMIYACPTWELEADNYLLKLKCLQNKVLCTIGNFPRCTLICNLHMAFSLLYVYDYK
jgi:hypothetical protein